MPHSRLRDSRVVRWLFYTALAVAHYISGRYTEAISFGRKAVQQRPNLPDVTTWAKAGGALCIDRFSLTGTAAPARFWSKADMCNAATHVRFTPEIEHWAARPRTLLTGRL
jgi:hypothetical protein